MGATPVEVSPGPGPVDRTPPQDLAAEQSVLGAMLMSKDAIADVVETLKGRDFYRPAHELIFDAILDLYGRGEPADPVTVADELGKRGEIQRVGGHVYLADLLASVSIAANAGYYAEIVRDKATLRRLVEASIKIAQLGYQGQGDVSDIVDEAQQTIYQVSEGKTSDDYKPLSMLIEPAIDEIESIANRGDVMYGVPTGFAELDDLTNGLHAGQMIIIAARPAMGKALALDTPLPTPTGWTTMGDVQVGDELIAADGRPTRVVAATDVMRDRPCYRITFSDGTQVIADAEHEWPAVSRADRRTLAERRSRAADEMTAGRDFTASLQAVRLPEAAGLRELVACGPAHPTRVVRATAPQVLGFAAEEPSLQCQPWERIRDRSRDDGSDRACVTTAAMAASVRLADNRCNWSVRLAESLDLPTRELPLDPHALGVWLADGSSTSARFPSADTGVAEHMRGSVQAILHGMGLVGNKHIPRPYLRASREQRLDLLRGLMDTSGAVASAGGLQFMVTNERLARDTYELIVSLGLRCTRRTRLVRERADETSTAHVMTFTGGEEHSLLGREREMARTRRRERTSPSDRYVTAVEPIPSVPVRCVQVDNAEHLYLATESMIPTHNSTLALDFARSASIKHGLTSAFFSLEMSQTEIVMRLLSAEAQVPLSHIRGGKMTEEDWSRVVRKTAQVSEAPLFIDDSPNLTMMEIRSKARRLKQRHDLKLAVIDYMQLMTSGKKVESRQLEVSEFSRQIKLLAKELEIPVVALSQLNRGPEQRVDKKPMLSDLRESGSLEQDADMVILLNRDDVYDKESSRAGEADLIIAKNRSGPTKTIVTAFQGHYSRFVDMQH